jgi:hypothetical protein
MTLIVGFNMASYGLLVADTRLTFINRDGSAYYRDDARKIQRTEMGIITGAGFGNLLDAVKARLADEEITQTDRVQEIIEEEIEEVRQRRWHRPDRVEESIQMTAWMLTYIAADKYPDPSPDQIRFRVAFTVPDHGHKFAMLQPNTSWLLPPTGTTAEQQDDWHAFIKSNIRPLTPEEDLGINISHHVALAAQLTQEVSRINDGVAPTFQIGIHIFPFHLQISNVVAGPDFDIDWQTPGASDD